jgi:hypothetical protein
VLLSLWRDADARTAAERAVSEVVLDADGEVAIAFTGAADVPAGEEP